jgi:uncharacterized protein with HEPN domain
MSPSPRDSAYLWDMLQAARRILEFARDLDRADYMESDLVQAAVERQLEILGEAARRVSAEYREEHGEIPWRKIIGQRNVLAHEYGDVDQERIWEVISSDIAGLIMALEPLIPPLPPEAD